MIELNENLLLGKGTKRFVYIHPNDNTKCIKILKSPDSKKAVKRELNEYKKLVKRDISWKMLSKYYKKVKTNLGDGYIFDLIRDYDGEISKTLPYYLNDKHNFKNIINPTQCIQNFKDYILKNSIVVGDISFANIVYQRVSSVDGKFVVIDGVENSEFIPIATYVNHFREKKIKRKLARVDKNLKKYQVYLDYLNKNQTPNNNKSDT